MKMNETEVYLQGQGLNGPTGLIASVILRAARDATGSDGPQAADALAYFSGPGYRHHVTWLGFSPERLPAALRNEKKLARMVHVVLEDGYDKKREKWTNEQPLD